MKRNDLAEIKKSDIKDLLVRVSKARAELTGLRVDKSMGKISDLKAVLKKRKDLAQLLTVLRQKQLISEIAGKDQDAVN